MPLRAIWPEVPRAICYIIRNTCKSVRRHVLCYCMSERKHEFGQNQKENIILIGPGQICCYIDRLANKDKWGKYKRKVHCITFKVKV